MPINVPRYKFVDYNNAIGGALKNQAIQAKTNALNQQNQLNQQMAPLKLQAQQAATEAQGLKVLIAKTSFVNDQKSYNNWRNNAIRVNPQIGNSLPIKYSPAYLNNFNQHLTNQYNIRAKQLGLETVELQNTIAKQKQQMLQDYMKPGSQQTTDFGQAYKRDVTGNLLGIKNPALDTYVKQGLRGGMQPSGELSPELKATAQAMANYEVAPLTGRAAASPQARFLMNEVKKINRNYDSKLYKSRQAAIQAFSTGKQGDIVRSMNVGVQHLDLLDNLVSALENGDYHLINKARQHWKRTTGYPAPTNFDTAKQIVADEISKAVIGGQTAQQDREELSRNLDRANSPEQLGEVIHTLEGLMHGQLSGLRQQYITSTDRTDAEFNNKLSAHTLSVLHKFDTSQNGVAVQPSQPLPPANQQGAPQSLQPTTQDQEAIQWARQNPNDHRAAQILKINGMQ